MEEFFKHWTFLLAAGIEAAAAVVIGLAAAQGIARALALFVLRQAAEQDAKENLLPKC